MPKRAWLPVAVVGSYLLLWTLAYVVWVGLDFEYFVEYLRLAWTGPGEVPAFVQMTALIATATSWLGYWIVKRR